MEQAATEAHPQGLKAVPSAQPSFVRSAAMQDAVQALDGAVQSTGGVLVCGEPGSGRKLFARAIHIASARPEYPMEELLRLAMGQTPADGRPFVSVDCADRESIEERLFGARGNGARESGEIDQITEDSKLYKGIGGTLVLGQLTDMPLRVQVRLGRMLRDGEVLVKRDGGSVSVSQVALRPVGTVEKPESLSPDLYRRLSHALVTVPPLRARHEDIPGLVLCLVEDLCAAAGVESKTVSRQAIDLLTALPWRGNVAELRALLRALVSRVSTRQIRLRDVLAHVRLDGQLSTGAYTGTLREARASFERDYVAAVLDQHRGRMAEAARALGLQRTNLYRKVRQLAVRRRSPSRPTFAR